MKKPKTSEPVIVRVPLDSLKLDPKNPRIHGEKNLKAIADSLARFGQVEPILVEKKSRKIIGGHGRVAALREQGATECLVVELDVAGKESRALALALNRAGDLAEYDNALLLEALEGLDVPGFDEDDLEAMFGEKEEEPKPDPGPSGPTSVRILLGDVRERLKDIESDSVQCVVTSPPYWGLRDYGTARWEGGKKDHEHVGTVARTVAGGTGKQQSNVGACEVYSGDCACGARRIDSQIGLEQTPDEFVEQLVAVFREVRRVLRPDGTLWMNLGDSYAGSNVDGGTNSLETGRRATRMHRETRAVPRNLKQKDLCGIPWTVAMALRADGWFLRSDIIWAKPNPMPESVTDRPTKAHEYVFLLSKSGEYFYDVDAIREHAEAPPSSVSRSELRIPDLETLGLTRGKSNPSVSHPLGANARTVWTIVPEPTAEAHFATFPTELVRRCLAAGSKPGDVVLDPFFGAGTTGLVAARMGRSAIGCELNRKYAEIASRRIHSDKDARATVTIE